LRAEAIAIKQCEADRVSLAGRNDQVGANARTARDRAVATRNQAEARADLQRLQAERAQIDRDIAAWEPRCT
jgi:hypothetical protein